MIFLKKTETPPSSLVKEHAKSNGTYNQQDVKSLLYEDFFGKCYICEILPLQDGGVIEHLFAHKGDKTKMFDWGNLFLSCGHCNSVKNCNHYESDIINCTKMDPSELLIHKLEGDIVHMIVVQSESISAVKTAQMIQESFNGNSTITRKHAATIRIDALKHEMAKFFSVLNKYKKEPKDHYKNQIIALISPKTSFTAFKRDYIRYNNEFTDFLEYF